MNKVELEQFISLFETDRSCYYVEIKGPNKYFFDVACRIPVEWSTCKIKSVYFTVKHMMVITLED